MKVIVSLIVLMLVTVVDGVGDVGGNVRDELAHVQISSQFKDVAVDHGSIGGGLERWKLATSDVEQHIFTIDGHGLNGRVERETYVRITGIDPYGLQPNDAGAQHGLRDVITPREYADYSGASFVGKVTETPLHLYAYFYRGRFAAYEVLEPQRRSVGVLDRFEWRSFPL